MADDNNTTPASNEKPTSTKKLYEGPILDSHVHFWDPKTTPRVTTPLVRLLGWNPRLLLWTARRIFPQPTLDFFVDPGIYLNPFLPEDHERGWKECGDIDTKKHLVEGVVHVEAGWHGDDPVGETVWLDQLDGSGGDGGTPIRGIVAHADLTQSPTTIEQVIESHVQASSRVCGIRQQIAWHPDGRLYDAPPPNKAELTRSSPFRESFPLLAKHGLTFETFCYHTQLDEMKDLALAFPEQKILIDHLGTPIAINGAFLGWGATEEERSQTLKEWKESMIQLSQCPNVYVKLSGLGMPVCGHGFEKNDDAPPPQPSEVAKQFGPLIQFVIDTFGVRRCMFASNFPVDKVSLTWDTLFTAYKIIVNGMKYDDQERLFRGTAIDFYGITGSCEGDGEHDSSPKDKK